MGFLGATGGDGDGFRRYLVMSFLVFWSMIFGVTVCLTITLDDNLMGKTPDSDRDRDGFGGIFGKSPGLQIFKVFFFFVMVSLVFRVTGQR